MLVSCSGVGIKSWWRQEHASSCDLQMSNRGTHELVVLERHELDRGVREDAEERGQVALEQPAGAVLAVDLLSRVKDPRERSCERERA